MVSALEQKINLFAVLGAPMVDRIVIDGRQQLIHQHVLPEIPQVIGAKIFPPPAVADKPRVKSIDLRHRH